MERFNILAIAKHIIEEVLYFLNLRITTKYWRCLSQHFKILSRCVFSDKGLATPFLVLTFKF